MVKLPGTNGHKIGPALSSELWKAARTTKTYPIHKKKSSAQKRQNAWQRRRNSNSLKALFQSLSQSYADLATRRTVLKTWSNHHGVTSRGYRHRGRGSCNFIQQTHSWHKKLKDAPLTCVWCMTLWPYVLTIRTAAYCLGLSFEHQEARVTWSSRHRSESSKGISSKPLLLTFAVLVTESELVGTPEIKSFRRRCVPSPVPSAPAATTRHRISRNQWVHENNVKSTVNWASSVGVLQRGCKI